MEIIYFFGKHVKDKGFHIYLYGGLSACNELLANQLIGVGQSIVKNNLKMPSSNFAGVSLSVSIVFVYKYHFLFKKNKPFESSDYEHHFLCTSITVHHIKGTLAIGSSCMSISIGISTDITSFSFSALDYTEYIQLNVKIDNMYSLIKSKYKFMF